MPRTLDTNICSYILRRHPPCMIERFAREFHRVPGLAVEEWTL